LFEDELFYYIDIRLKNKIELIAIFFQGIMSMKRNTHHLRLAQDYSNGNQIVKTQRHANDYLKLNQNIKTQRHGNAHSPSYLVSRHSSKQWTFQVPPNDPSDCYR
jgi:hypothetical protein